jgi:hypothetical protein
MLKLIKRAVVIQDLIDISTYISLDNLEAGDRFLYAAEATKHYLEDSVWAKASLTYFDKMSETPDQGA